MEIIKFNSLNKNFVLKLILGFIFLFLFRFGVHIPAPGVNIEHFLSKIIDHTSNNSLFGTITTISSGVFGSFSLLSLGVMPYILASILTQIVSYIYQEEKGLKNQKEQDFFSKISRIFTLVFALIQSIMLFWTIKDKCSFFYCNFDSTLIYILAFLSILTGSMISMWIGETISEYSIGSGVSMIIFTNIGFDFISSFFRVISADSSSVASVILATFMIFIVLCVIVLCEKSVRLVEVQYSSFNKFDGVKALKSSFIPLKLNFSGVMPMIFTMTITAFLMSMLNHLIGVKNGTFDNLLFFFLRNQWFYYVLYFILIFAFSLLYNGITFNVEKVSDSLRKSSGVLPGIKPGLDTKNYLSYILSRLTFLGAIYLFLVSLSVDFFKFVLNMNSFIGGTSYLIITVIALELISKYEIEFLSSKYNDYSI